MSAGVVLASGAGRPWLREVYSTGSESELVEGSCARSAGQVRSEAILRILQSCVGLPQLARCRWDRSLSECFPAC